MWVCVCPVYVYKVANCAAFLQPDNYVHMWGGAELCVRVRERDRQTDRQRKREMVGERRSELCVCVCVAYVSSVCVRARVCGWVCLCVCAYGRVKRHGEQWAWDIRVWFLRG